jgi:hypothetical protein
MINEKKFEKEFKDLVGYIANKNLKTLEIHLLLVELKLFFNRIEQLKHKGNAWDEIINS